MAIFTTGMQPVEESREKGLKTGALGLASSVVIGVASTAPAYSLAATLFFVVAAVGLKSPLVAVLAFVPMLLCSIGFSELNKADPDCGTTFIWGTRAFGPSTGWAGGWATVAADLLVMGSLAQVAGQYLFFLFQGPNSSIGANASGGWVLLVGVLWIVVITYICYRGIELSARFQREHLGAVHRRGPGHWVGGERGGRRQGQNAGSRRDHLGGPAAVRLRDRHRR